MIFSLLGSLTSTPISQNLVVNDIKVNLQPIQLHFDLRIIDRLERYIMVLSGNSNAIYSREEISSKSNYSEHSTSQHIIDDLDTQRLKEVSFFSNCIKSLFTIINIYIYIFLE